MGYNNLVNSKSDNYVLVIMSNKDVYYMWSDEAKHLIDLIADNNYPTFYEIIDAKSLATITLHVDLISSFVDKGACNA